MKNAGFRGIQSKVSWVFFLTLLLHVYLQCTSMTLEAFFVLNHFPGYASRIANTRSGEIRVCFLGLQE